MIETEVSLSQNKTFAIQFRTICNAQTEGVNNPDYYSSKYFLDNDMPLRRAEGLRIWACDQGAEFEEMEGIYKDIFTL